MSNTFVISEHILTAEKDEYHHYDFYSSSVKLLLI